MKVKFKKLKATAVLPQRIKEGDAGMDLTAIDFEFIDNEHVKYNFGFAVEIPKGYAGFIFPRSSIYKQKQLLSNSVGVVDSNYRGEVSVVMLGNPQDHMYRNNQRVAQMIIMPYPQVEPEWSEELSDTERGTGGYGSSGK